MGSCVMTAGVHAVLLGTVVVCHGCKKESAVCHRMEPTLVNWCMGTKADERRLAKELGKMTS